MNIIYETNNVLNLKNNIQIDPEEKNILIIGPGIDETSKLEILNPQNESEAISIYGDSTLYNSYLEAYKITKRQNIYTINCFTNTDYIEVIDYILQYNFDYIIPVGINLRDTFFNPIENKRIRYIEYYLDSLYKINSSSTIICTDKHAELYEDIDTYIYEMLGIVESFTISKEQNLNIYGNNLIFVLNTIKNIEYSNVIVAALMTNIKYAEHPNALYYPDYKLVYDIDYSDIETNNICYFKHNLYNDSITIDNFFNLRQENDEYKVVMIDYVIKRIMKLISMDEYKGRLYTPYIRLAIENKLKSILNKEVNRTIASYKINKINFVKTDKTSGYIYIELNVMPYGSVEYLKIVRVV